MIKIWDNYSPNNNMVGDPLNSDKGITPFFTQMMLSLRGLWGESPAGQQEFTTPGSTTFTVPAGVSSISAVAVGGGGGANACPGNSNYSGAGGGGGGLSYATSIVVNSWRKH